MPQSPQLKPEDIISLKRRVRVWEKHTLAELDAIILLMVRPGGKECGSHLTLSLAFRKDPG